MAARSRVLHAGIGGDPRRCVFRGPGDRGSQRGGAARAPTGTTHLLSPSGEHVVRRAVRRAGVPDMGPDFGWTPVPRRRPGQVVPARGWALAATDPPLSLSTVAHLRSPPIRRRWPPLPALVDDPHANLSLSSRRSSSPQGTPRCARRGRVPFRARAARPPAIRPRSACSCRGRCQRPRASPPCRTPSARQTAPRACTPSRGRGGSPAQQSGSRPGRRGRCGRG